MSDAKSFFVTNSSGAPLLGGAAGMVVFARDVTSASRTAPSVTELGEGMYQVVPTDADETVGTVLFVDCGVGNNPRRVSFACYKADRSNQFFTFHVEDAAGALWAGAAPTVGNYRSSLGVSRTPPALLAVSGSFLFVAVPTPTDIAMETSLSVVGPSGSSQPYWSEDTKPISAAADSVAAPITSLVTDLRSCWLFNNNANDELGVNNGTATDVTYTTNAVGLPDTLTYTAVFNGTGSKIDISADAVAWRTDNWACHFWIKAPSVGPATRSIVSCWGIPTGGLAGWGLQLESGILKWYKAYLSGYALHTGVDIADGLWHSVLITHTETPSLNSLFVDGVERISTTGQIAYDSSSIPAIGWRPDATAQPFFGELSQVTFWRGAKTVKEAQQLYLNGDAAAYPFTFGGGAAASGSNPTITIISPTTGSIISAYTNIELSVADPDGLSQCVLIAKFAGLDSEVIHDGTNFTQIYTGSLRTSIVDGFQYSVVRASGWHASPTLQVLAIDSLGSAGV